MCAIRKQKSYLLILRRIGVIGVLAGILNISSSHDLQLSLLLSSTEKFKTESPHI
jgi:hypothetical protein